jgi:hypothetical protein
MSGKVLVQMQNPVTQSIDAVKSLLQWKKIASDPLPADVSLDNGRLVLVLSNKKDVFYTVTPTKCSCPSATYHPGQPCKHQRKHFGANPVTFQATGSNNNPSSIKPACKWPGGLNGPVDEPIKAVV